MNGPVISDSNGGTFGRQSPIGDAIGVSGQCLYSLEGLVVDGSQVRLFSLPLRMAERAPQASQSGGRRVMLRMEGGSPMHAGDGFRTDR